MITKYTETIVRALRQIADEIESEAAIPIHMKVDRPAEAVEDSDSIFTRYEPSRFVTVFLKYQVRP